MRKVNAADSALHLPTFLRIRDESFERVVPVRHNDARQPPQSTALRQEFERNIDDERERERESNRETTVHGCEQDGENERGERETERGFREASRWMESSRRSREERKWRR